MDDKSISSFNRVSDPIFPCSKLVEETNESTGNGGPPPPTIRSRESEQKILNRQQAARSSPTQTQTNFIATALLQTSAPIESAELISNEINYPPVSVYVRLAGKGGRANFETFDNVSDLNQLRSDIKQRFGIEGEFSLVGAGILINDMSQLHKAWHKCDGRLYMVLPLKDSPSEQINSEIHHGPTILPVQTQTDVIATVLPQTSAPIEPAELISDEINFPAVRIYVKFVGKGSKGNCETFANVSDLNRLRSDIKQRFGIEEEFSLIGAGRRINDMSQLRKAWDRCDGLFHMVLNNKT